MGRSVLDSLLPVGSSPLAAPPERPSVRTRRQDALLGALCVLGSAVAFSAKAVIAKVAYRHGADPATVLSLRFVFALPFFALAAVAASRGRAPLPRRDLGLIVLLGVLGYYGASVLDFYGLLYISAGLERLILFVYPTLVVLLGALMFGTPITRRIVLALLLTYAGVALAVKTETAGMSGENLWLGVSLVFIGTLAYAGYLVGGGQLIPRIGAVRFTSLALIAATLAMLVHFVLVGGSFFGHPPLIYVYGLVLALVCTVLPVFLLAEGIRRIGAAPASIIGGVGPVSTIVLAHFALGEPVHLIQALGTALVLTGATIIARPRA